MTEAKQGGYALIAAKLADDLEGFATTPQSVCDAAKLLREFAAQLSTLRAALQKAEEELDHVYGRCGCGWEVGPASNDYAPVQVRQCAYDKRAKAKEQVNAEDI